MKSLVLASGIAWFLAEGATASAQMPPPKLVYHNGHVINTPKIYTIAWGASSGPDSFTTAEVQVMANYLSHLAGYITEGSSANPNPNMEPTIRQYGVINASFPAGIPIYTDSPKADGTNTTAILNVIKSRGETFDAQSIVVVAVKGSAVSCQPWHAKDGQGLNYVYVPYRPCFPAPAGSGETASEFVFEGLASREIFEAITNPDGASGWFADASDPNIGICGKEIADCDGVSGAAGCASDSMVTFSGGSKGNVAHMIDNRSGRCQYFVPIRQSAQLSFAPPEDLGANLAGAGGAALSSWIGHLDVFAAGADHKVYTKHCYGACNGDWSGWTTLPTTGAGTGIFSQPAATSWAPNRIDVVGLSSTGSVLHIASVDGNTWGNWDNVLGGSGYKRVSIDSQGAGTLDVYGVRADGGLDINQYKNGTWSGWLSIPGSTGKLDTTASLGAASWRDIVEPASHVQTGARIDVMGFKSSTLPHNSAQSGWGAWDLIPPPSPACNASTTFTARDYGQLFAACNTSSGSSSYTVYQSNRFCGPDGPNFNCFQVGWSPWASTQLTGFTIIGASTSWNGARTDLLLVDASNNLKHTFTR
jgi:hypothetical protein